MIEFPPGVKLAELQRRYTRDDLIEATNEMIGTLLALVEGLPDSVVTFVPDDPDAYDPFAAEEYEVHMPWTLGHVIVHITASGEEAAARGAGLARGVQVKWRDRYETPWQSATTTAHLMQRLEESHRIRIAYLNAWPEQPHLDNLWTDYEERWGALDAVGMTLSGLSHDAAHLDQIREIIRQARAALG
jgi:hypothetical protein